MPPTGTRMPDAPASPFPDKNVCFVCKSRADEGESLKRCGKCSTTPYCSLRCQKADWKAHKLICRSYLEQKLFDSKTTTFGQKAPKGKKAAHLRSRGEIFQDLKIWGNEHNGDSLISTAWVALDLISDLEKANTHFLALTVRRNADSTTPRTIYRLDDASVLPLRIIEERFEHVGAVGPEMTEHPINILDSVRADKERRVREDGALGNVLIMTIELQAGEEKTPERAIRETNIPIFQPLGLFKVHQEMFSKKMPPPFYRLMKQESNWKACLRNALDGYAWSIKQPPQ